MRKIKFFVILIFIISCKSYDKHIYNFVNKKKYSNEFRMELLKRCMFQNSSNEFHKNIASDLYGSLPPPPPFYIKQSRKVIDSITILKKKDLRVIESCINISQSRNTTEVIESEYKKELKRESIE